MNFNTPKLGFTCVFTIQKFTENGSITYQGEEFYNTMLDCGLLGLADSALFHMFGGYMNHINIGSSSIPVDVTQTKLQNTLYTTSTVFNQQSYDVGEFIPETGEWYYGHVNVYQFSVGTVTGALTEVGLSLSPDSYYLNRQLIKDPQGNPITINVSSGEGLRIKAEVRVYLDPAVKLYSQIYKLNIKGATSGTITLSNGTTTKTMTYQEIVTYPGDFKRSMEYWLGVGEVTNFSGNITNGFYIYFNPTNISAYNLSIQSNTFVGNSGAPELTLIQPYSPAVRGVISYTDETIPSTINIGYMVTPAIGIDGQNHLTQRLGEPSNTQYNCWGYADYNGMVVMSVPLYNFAGQIITADGGFPTAVTGATKIKDATIDDLSWIQQCSVSSGALGIGDKQIQGFSLRNHGYYDSMPVLWHIKLDTPIVLKDTEEFNFKIKFSWGRYIQ